MHDAAGSLTIAKMKIKVCCRNVTLVLSLAITFKFSFNLTVKRCYLNFDCLKFVCYALNLCYAVSLKKKKKKDITAL